MEPVNLAAFEAHARDRLEPGAFGYISGGADDEITLRENVSAYRRIGLLPRMLRDVSTIDLTSRVCATAMGMPILLAPTGFQALAHPDGELATARAAAAAGLTMVTSTVSSYRLEEIATAAPGSKWFQLYCYKERSVTEELVQRAERAGYEAICLTIDVPRIGRRERDIVHRAALPPGAYPRNFEHVIDLRNVPIDEQGSAIASYVTTLFSDSLTWADVEWLRSVTTLPLLLKGILTTDDALLSLEHGADGIIVSNHGGRQLDGVPPTIEVLPEIAAAVSNHVPVLIDGGIRRGTDVVKALGLGANAVLIGRPYLWGLAVDGQAGVERVLTMLREEFELALALLGCRTPAEVGREHILPNRFG